MSGNTTGTLFTVTTWGESHGKAIGVVVDGCPPNIPLNEPDIQEELNRRRRDSMRQVHQEKKKIK